MMNRQDVPIWQLLRLQNASIAWTLLSFALLVTFALWYLSVRLVEDRTEAHFRTQSLQLKSATEQRLLNYEQVLAGSAGLFSVAGEVSREQWRVYAEGLDIVRYYPGIQGIGYIRRVGGAQVKPHIEALRQQGLPDYAVHPAGDRAEYYPITYLEPGTERNLRAFGYDAFEDKVHRKAMELAAHSGQPTMTDKVVLVQEDVDNAQAGFLMYYPLYKGSQLPATSGQRKRQLEGYVFSAFRMNTLMDGIVGLISPFLDVRIFNSETVSRETLMYASHLGSLDEEFSFEMNQTLDHGGRTWLMQTRSTPAFDYLASDPRPRIVLVAGLLVSLLVFALALTLVRSRLLAQMSAGRFRAISEDASNITLVLDRKGRVLYTSPSCMTILGFSADQVNAADPQTVVHADDWSHLSATFEQAVAHPGISMPVQRARVLDVEGEWREMVGSCTSMLEEPGVQGVVLSVRDLTELKVAQTELHRLAFYDPLTRLPNRQLFRDRLENAIRSSRRNGESTALMLLDLDGFKNINETLGHEAGDQFLQHVARWLRGCVREADSVARLGGDEFAVLLPGIGSPEAAAKMAETILRRLRKTVRLQNHTVGVTVSIGVTMIPHDSEDPGTLMKFADMAMYRAKDEGRDNCRFFTRGMNVQAERRLLLQEDLAESIESDRFVLHYQPRFDLARNRVTGVEAFMRWQHPEKGLMQAQQFIGLAEESGLIVRLGEIGLRQACIQIQALERAGFESLRVAVNLSARQLIDPSFLDRFRQVVTETGVSPDRLELELPAALMNHDVRQVREVLGALHDLGVFLILDDFGAGACSLAILQSLPLDAVKIDQRFIRDTPYNSSAMDVTSAVIALAHKLRLTVIAEGIETPQQLAFLKTVGCGQGQGNLFSNPMDEDALVGFLVKQYEKAPVP